jgi:hypothetical protein
MGKLNTIIDDDLEKAFRKAAYEAYGYRKGALQTAVEEAILAWLQNIGRPYLKVAAELKSEKRV